MFGSTGSLLNRKKEYRGGENKGNGGADPAKGRDKRLPSILRTGDKVAVACATEPPIPDD